MPGKSLIFGENDGGWYEMPGLAGHVPAPSTDLDAWGSILAHTTARVTEQPFYRALAELTIEFLLSDLKNLPASPSTWQPLQSRRQSAGQLLQGWLVDDETYSDCGCQTDRGTAQ